MGPLCDLGLVTDDGLVEERAVVDDGDGVSI